MAAANGAGGAGSGLAAHWARAVASLRAELAEAQAAVSCACGADERSRACMVARDQVEEISAALARSKERLAAEVGEAPPGDGRDPFGPNNPFAGGRQSAR